MSNARIKVWTVAAVTLPSLSPARARTCALPRLLMFRKSGSRSAAARRTSGAPAERPIRPAFARTPRYARSLGGRCGQGWPARGSRCSFCSNSSRRSTRIAAARAKTSDTTASRVAAGGGLLGNGRPVGRLSQPPAGRRRSADPVSLADRDTEVVGLDPTHSLDVLPHRDRVLIAQRALRKISSLHPPSVAGPTSGGSSGVDRHADHLDAQPDPPGSKSKDQSPKGRYRERRDATRQHPRAGGASGGVGEGEHARFVPCPVECPHGVLCGTGPRGGRG